MLYANIFDFTLWASIIEFAGGLLIVVYIIVAIINLIRHKDVIQARLIVADGVLTGLSFKLAGTLLKTIVIHTWQQILMFVVIFALRTILGRLFAWERDRLQRRLRNLA